MNRLTTIAVIFTLGTIGSAAAQESPVGLGTDLPLARSQHDAASDAFGYPGRQNRGPRLANSSNDGSIDRGTAASVPIASRAMGGNYGPQITEWELKSGR